MIYFLQGSKSEIKMKGSPDPKKGSPTLSEHLKLVEIKCDLVDERVLNVLKFLKTFNICKLNHHYLFSIFQDCSLRYDNKTASNKIYRLHIRMLAN